MKPNLLFVFLLYFTCLNSQAIQLKEVISDVEQPVDIKFFPKSTSELLIASKTGEITFADTVKNDRYIVHTLDVRSSSEMGLLGLAFHPYYSDNKFIFVNYFPEDDERRTRISRFTLTENKNRYTLTNEKIIIEISQPYRNHNGGQIAFGADGYFYIGMGDGGSGGDPKGHGQNTKTLLGNMLRIDVNTPDDKPYSIPLDNPFVKDQNFKPEIWAYGLRNPWRFSFNEDVLIVADVGQNKVEEVTIVEKGQNLGWNIMEAHLCFKPKKNCDTTGLTLPHIHYGRDQGQSITGGYVYNGKLNTELKNHYIYADFLSGNIWGVNYPTLSSPIKLMSNQGNLSTFALDASGEIYVAGYAKGIIYQIVP